MTNVTIFCDQMHRTGTNKIEKLSSEKVKFLKLFKIASSLNVTENEFDAAFESNKGRDGSSALSHFIISKANANNDYSNVLSD